MPVILSEAKNLVSDGSADGAKMVTARDREAVFAAGWSERALHDAVAVCALFNFMNRLVEGMGVKTSPAIQAAQRERHARAAQEHDGTPYMNFGRRIGIIP